MKKNTNPIPEGYHSVTPYLNVRDAAGLIDFLERAFGATRLERLDRPDGKVMHAEVRIGDSPVMIGEATDEMGPTPGCLYLYVEDVDAVFRTALDAGAKQDMEPQDMFWGDRMGTLKDKWQNTWSIGTHIEDVPADEIQKRASAFMEQRKSA